MKENKINIKPKPKTCGQCPLVETTLDSSKTIYLHFCFITKQICELKEKNKVCPLER